MIECGQQRGRGRLAHQLVIRRLQLAQLPHRLRAACATGLRGVGGAQRGGGGAGPIPVLRQHAVHPARAAMTLTTTSCRVQLLSNLLAPAHGRPWQVRWTGTSGTTLSTHHQYHAQMVRFAMLMPKASSA